MLKAETISPQTNSSAKLVYILSEEEQQLVDLISNIVVEQTLQQAYEKSDQIHSLQQ
jgi:hypothetical protein